MGVTVLLAEGDAIALSSKAGLAENGMKKL